MKKNIGNIDRIIRFVAGLGVLSLYFVLEGDTRYWALLGIVPMGTALLSWCPPYAMFGISTCPRKDDAEQ
ncbi:MAG: YgaP family membrane protein [Alphaproteobacteria bacterium]